jgi:hypothetical protein
MSNEEKLRVLLIEARVWVATSEPTMLMRLGIGWSEQKKLLAGIDAALAEPVGGCADCEIEIKARCLAQQERHEARAEVERLKEDLALWKEEATEQGKAHAYWMGESNKQYKRGQEDYQRGAEAMREAAAKRIDAEGINGVNGTYFGNIIRTMPIPEGKP